MNFTDKSSLNITSHSQISFLDIKIDDDTELFLDPYLVESRQDKWSKDSYELINDFFKKLYSKYKNYASDTEKYEFFSHSHEINATKLGYGNGENGHGCTPEELMRIFRQLETLIDEDIELDKFNYFTIFLRGFAEDHLSDMLTNILFFQLNQFTIDQCHRLGIRLSSRTDKTYYHWTKEFNWTSYNGECLLIDNKLILLVPKNIVQHRYPFSAGDFFKKEISKVIQEELTSYVNGKKVKPTKKKIYEDVREEGFDYLQKDIEYLKKKSEYLSNYNRYLEESYRNEDHTLTDEFLDIILKSN